MNQTVAVFALISHAAGVDIALVRLFVDVSQKLSFVAVANDRDINPSSVSRAINQLEQQLGVRLLQRTTRTMALTDAGMDYLQRVGPILEEFDAATDAVRGATTAVSGTLRLTASVAFGERVLVPLLPRLRDRHPRLELQLVFTDATLDLVSESIDLAIRLGPRLAGDVVTTRLFATAYRVVASPQYLESAASIEKPADLAHHACTVFSLPAFRSEWRFRKRDGRGHRQSHVVEISPGIAVSSALSLRSIVLAGGGPALLADWLVDDDIAAGRLVDVLPGYDVTATDFDTGAWLVYPTRAYLPRKVRAAIDFLTTELRRPGN